MTELFSVVLTTGWRACPALLVVFAARLLLQRAPAAVWRPLWWGAFFRLACPFALLLPVPVSGETAQVLGLREGGNSVAIVAGAGFDPVTLPGTGIEVGRAAAGVSPAAVLAVIWAAGCLGMLAWGLVSLLRFARCLTGAVRLKDNIWQGDDVPAPVTVGVLRPRVYLPSALEGRERGYVILHERTHIRWGDPAFKLLAFLLVAVHWFNPLAWGAFLWACRDLEAACDQGVLARTGARSRQEYAAALFHLSTGRKVLAGGPPAFGEGDAQGRIRRVMAYRKAPRWAGPVAGAAAAAAVAVAVLGPVPEVYAAEKPLGFVPYDSFFFTLMPGEARDYPRTITLTETGDFHYQVTWTPTGLNTEVVLGTESGERVGTGSSYLVDGRGGVAAGVFEDVPPGEYRLIIRSAVENGEYTNTAPREDLEIAGAAAFGWREGDAWKAPDTPQEGSITFPAYREGREDYNAAVYDIQPFQLSIRLPEGWTVRVPPQAERRTSYAFTPLWLYQGEEYAGSIAYNTFEIYPDVPPENFYRMVYNQLMLGSVINWDNEYTVVRDWGSGCSATVQIMESQVSGVAGLTDTHPGILAYDRDQLVYVAIELENGRLSGQEVWDLAESLEIYR